MTLHPLNKLTIAILLSMTAVGCGGGGGGGSDDTASGGNPPQQKSAEITVFDGLLSNASVCLDANSNGQCEQNEFSLRTNEQGIALIPADKYQANQPIIATAVAGETIDLSRGPISKSFQLSAPAGYQVVNPFTTLISQQMHSGSSESEALQQLAEELQQMDSSKDVNYYAELIKTDFTQGKAMQQKRALRVAEMLTDQYVGGNYSLQQLLAFVDGLSIDIGEVSDEDLEYYYPQITFGDGLFGYIPNQAPQATGSIEAQTLDYLGDPITEVDLHPLFSDADGDRLSYTLYPAVAGLSINNGILSGTPEAAGNYQLSIMASDAATRSRPISFQLTVKGEVKPVEPMKKLVGFTDLGVIPAHDVILHSHNALYFVNFNPVSIHPNSPNSADVVRVDTEGNRSTGSLRGTWHQEGGSPRFYNGYNPKLGEAGYYAISAPYELDGNYYFSGKRQNMDGSLISNKDGDPVYGTWRFSFTDNGGIEEFTLLDLDTDIDGDGEADVTSVRCHENNHFQGNQCFHGYNGSFNQQSTSIKSDFNSNEIPNFDENTIHHNGKYYEIGEQDNIIEMYEETITYDETEARYVSSFKRTDIPLEFNDSTGMPVRTTFEAQMLYHEGLDGLIFIAEYSDPSEGSHDHNHLFAFVDGKTNQVTDVQLTYEKRVGYTHNYALVPTKTGALVVMGEGINFSLSSTTAVVVDFNVDKFTATQMEVPFPIAFSELLKETWQNADGTFFGIESDEEHIILSQFE